MKELGYDILDINDPFYQDICSPYKSDNNTDILLSDRIDYIYNNKDSQCQSNCKFSSYLLNSLYLNCTCDVTENKNEENKFNGKKIYESFYDILKYANFNILKCYNLIFNKNIFSKNLGSYIIIGIFLFYFVSFVFFFIKGTVPLINKLKKIMLTKEEKKEEKIENINNIIVFKNNKKDIKSSLNILTINKVNTPPVKRNISKNIYSKSIINNSKTKKKKIKHKIIPINFFILPKIEVNNNSIEKNKFPNSNNILNNSKDKEDINKIKIENINTEKKDQNQQKQLDAFELNELEHEEAIILDKRSFIQTYWDILSREHNFIFTFIIRNDYNLSYIKYARFIFLIATDMAMNVFFFSDDSMHKIFLNYGKYNFIQQIPQIVYTSIVSQLIEILLCYLSLTDKYIYQIKNISHNKTFEDKDIIKILKCIKIKIITFYIFTFIFFGFYWYLVTAFCAVYQNTQVTFLKDCLFSFLLGIIYPFILYLIPSGLRILSLRYPNKGIKCVYKLSDIIPFF